MIGSLLHHHLNCFFNTLYIEIRETENQKEKNKLSGKNKEEFGAGFRVKSGTLERLWEGQTHLSCMTFIVSCLASAPFGYCGGLEMKVKTVLSPGV